MSKDLYAITATLTVEGANFPSPRQVASLFRLLDEAAVLSWLVEKQLPFRNPPRRIRVRARNGLLEDPDFARVDHVHFGSPVHVRSVVGGARRAGIVVAATAAIVGGTLIGVNKALDQVSETIERVEQIYEQIRDFGEEEERQIDDRRILKGRKTEPTLRPGEVRLERLNAEGSR